MNTGASPKKLPTGISRLPLLRQAATVLCEHPAVRDAVACRQSSREDARGAAFVVADENYIEDALGGKTAASKQIQKWRKIYDLSQLAKAATASPFGFNIAGWKSSYTRQPLPQEDMREWVQTTVDRISALPLTEVLEIGCGSGLLLLRLASECKRYVGLDFAAAVLARVRDQLAQSEDLRQRVELLERSADDFEGFRENTFGTVIVNSVAQHFPSQAYLNRVMENAIRVVRPGGHVFVGDQRNLVLLDACAVSVEAFQAAPEVSVAELRSRVHRYIQQEQQLVLSPSYFLSLAQRLPKVSRVEIYPRRGTRDNEMTRFRYDVLVWVGPALVPPTEIPFFDPPVEGWKLCNVRSLLTAGKADGIGFARIRNSRVDADIRLLERVASADPQQMFGELRQQLDQGEAEGIHPEEIVCLAAEMGYKVSISWAACYRDGSYDAAFLRRRASDHASFPPVKWPQPTPADLVYYSNAPGQSEIREKLVDELILHCRARLPEEFVPASVHPVDSLPRTADDSIDCDALLSATGVTSGRCLA